MFNKVLYSTLLLAFVAAPVTAQTRVEAAAGVGWTFADGVDGDPIQAGDGNVYYRADPKDSFSWDLRLGVLFDDKTEIGFLYGRQQTSLELVGSTKRTLGDMPIQTYHGYIGYNWGLEGDPIRPYALIGFGSTNYSSVQFTDVTGARRSTGGETQFSTTIGMGIKAFPNPNFGFQGGLRWTPTYIKSDPGGYWCDPYWGCYMTGNAQYSNQFQFTAGVVAKF